ncbi:hypothetical protein ACJX0J_039810, partial [Zea mays]
MVLQRRRYEFSKLYTIFELGFAGFSSVGWFYGTFEPSIRTKQGQYKTQSIIKQSSTITDFALMHAFLFISPFLLGVCVLIKKKHLLSVIWIYELKLLRVYDRFKIGSKRQSRTFHDLKVIKI